MDRLSAIMPGFGALIFPAIMFFMMLPVIQVFYKRNERITLSVFAKFNGSGNSSPELIEKLQLQ
jgi:hypothetical protein